MAYLNLLVITSGFSVMALEIVASRFFAPYIGTSVFIWTTLIGIIMAGLAIGYALGGYLGDTWKSMTRLQLLVAGAAIWILLLALVRDPFLESLSQTFPSLLDTAVLGSIALLGVPSVLLGSVTPYAVRLASKDIMHVGRKAGWFSALSTAGSIGGTFFAGFALIPSLGTTTILFILSLVLLGVVLLRPAFPAALVGVASLVLLSGAVPLEETLHKERLASKGVIEAVDSPYGSIFVQEVTWEGSEAKLLRIGRTWHGAAFTESSDLVFPYTKLMRLSDLFKPSPSRALQIGGGTYTIPRDFLARHPNATVDVVEIDPVVTELSETYFGLREDPRLQIFHEDARMFLNRGGPPYDVIFADAFLGNEAIPFHLTTLETAEKVSKLLGDSGIYLVNVISSLEGPRSRFFKAELRTLEEVFPQVLVFDVHAHFPPSQDRNILLIASKVPADLAALESKARGELKEYLAHRIDVTPDPSALLLTDEFAPVEALLQL